MFKIQSILYYLPLLGAKFTRSRNFFLVDLSKMAESKSDVIKPYEESLSIAKEVGDRAEEGRAYGKLGLAYRRLSDFNQAIECHKQELNIAKELDDKTKEGRAYGNLGLAHSSLGEFKQAIEYHNQGLSIAREIGNKPEEGRAYGNLGEAYKGLGDIKEAIVYHKRDLGISLKVRDKAEERRAYGNLGVAYNSLGDFKKAIEYLKQNLSIAKEVRDRAEEGRAYGNLGLAHRSRGDFKQAIEYHKQGLDIAKEVKDRAEEGRAYGNLGLAYSSLGDFKEAIEYHKQGLSIAKEVGDRAEEARVYGNLGLVYRKLSDFQQAIEYHKQGLSIAKEVGDRAEEGRSRGNLGLAYSSLSDFKQAIEHSQQELSIAITSGNKAGKGRAYGNLGVAYQGLGDFEQASEYHQNDLSISKEIGDKAEEARAYGNLALAWQSQGDTRRSIKYHKDGLSIAKEIGEKAEEGRLCGNIGIVCRMVGNLEEAIDYLNQDLNIAKEIGDKAEEGRVYGNLGDAYNSRSDFNQAIEYHKKALGVAKEVGDRDKEGGAFYSLGCIYERLGSLDEALPHYQSSVHVYNNMRVLLRSGDAWKISLRKKCKNAYTALWRTLVGLGKTDEAFYVAEQGRALALKDLMELRYDVECPHAELSDPKETIPRILSEMSTPTLFFALESENINLWLLKGKEIHYEKKKIEDATLLMKRMFKEFDIYAPLRMGNNTLVEQRSHLTLFQKTGLELLESLHRKKDSLDNLFKSVIGPIENMLQGEEELLIVPDGPFYLAPYAAFRNESLKYLSEWIRIRIIPSLTSLHLIRNSPEGYHSKTGALLVGDPCMDIATYKSGEARYMPLPYSKKEVEMISEILDVKPLIGREAAKDEVLKRISSVALIHIASHVKMETAEIVLAPIPSRTHMIPDTEDYMLTLPEVLALQVRARLVVLSCSHSAQGEITPDGVIGVARAFLAAGARSVLVALWHLDTDATIEFMRNFYQQLADGKSASVAVDAAMKCLRGQEKFTTIKHWAPFLLIGDDVTLDVAKLKQETSKQKKTL